MRSTRRVVLWLLPVAAMIAAVVPAHARAQTSTPIFALDASLYPPHTHVAGRIPDAIEAEEFIGSMHHSSFDQLGRYPDAGWFQGAVWQPRYHVTLADGSRHGRQALITSGYLVSKYVSPAQASSAVQDLYLIDKNWRPLNAIPGGRIVTQTKDGYSFIGGAFADGQYDVEDITIVSPHTPQRFYHTIRAAMIDHLRALDRITHTVDAAA